VTAINVTTLRTSLELYIGTTAYAQTLYVAPVERRPDLPGVLITKPGEVIPPLRLTLRHRYDPWAAVVEFDQGKDYRWQDQLNEAGAGSLVLANDDPDLALVQAGDVVLFEVEGFGAFTLLVREIDRTTIATGEEAAQLSTLSGPGGLAYLEEALVYPSRGVGVWPIEEDRVFSWPSVDYDDSWWTSVHAYASVYDSTPAWYGMIDGWPLALPAQWIGPSVGSRHWAPGGTCYLRSTFDAFTTGTYTIYLAADDFATLYLDGQQLLSTDEWSNDPNDVKKEQVDITAGEHSLAVELHNGFGEIIYEGGRFNPAAIVVGVATLDGAGAIAEVATVSDNSWRILEYPLNAPGMTPGEAMLICINEARDRGALPEIGATFDARVDSAGQPWPIVGDIATKTGYDLLTFFRELSQTYIDLAMSPAGNVLYAWASGTRGEHRSITLHAPSDASDPNSGNLVQLTHKRVLAPVERLLVRWKSGWDQLGNNGREACLGLGADQSQGEIERVGQAQLDDINNVRTEIAAQIAPMGPDDTPVLAFNIGDYLDVPDVDNMFVERRVISLSGALDDNGRLSWAIELGDRILDVRERVEQAAKKMINGTLRGSSKVATPVALVPKRNVPIDRGGGGCGG